MRNGTVGREAKLLYTNRLCKEPVQDVVTALEKLGEAERGEYEPAIPEVGGLLALVHSVTVARMNRLEAEKKKRLVRWQCPDCRVTSAGYVRPEGSLDQRCTGIPKSGKTGMEGEGVPICGARMEVIFDESVDCLSESVHEVDLSELLGR